MTAHPLPGWSLLIQAILTGAKLTFLSTQLLYSYVSSKLKLHCKLKPSYLTCTAVTKTLHAVPDQCFVTKAKQSWAFLFKIKYLLLSHLNDPENKKSLNWKTKLRSGRIRAFIKVSIIRRHLGFRDGFLWSPSSTRQKLRMMLGEGWGCQAKGAFCMSLIAFSADLPNLKFLFISIIFLSHISCYTGIPCPNAW